jgi:hypothetical protein
MNSETAQKLWKIYCDELILDNGDKTSEDVRQALATFLRVLTDYCEGRLGTTETWFVTSKDLLDTADLLEKLE